MTQAKGKTGRGARGASPVAALPQIWVEQVTPQVDAGRYAPKRVVGAPCEIGAAVFKDGHDLLAARVRYRGPGDGDWRSAPLTYLYDADRWVGTIVPDAVGAWQFRVEAWTDRWGTWRSGLEKKLGAGQQVPVELLEGALLLENAARRQRFGGERSQLQQAATRLRDETASEAERARLALSPELLALMALAYVPDDLTCSRDLPLRVDAERAAFASWYEFFPRSTAPEPGRHGTFRDAEGMLPRIAELGFDVVYLPPIHPIGRTFRKGRNNSLTPEPDDVGSPWAIGNEHGGHDAVEPALGTVEDFERFVTRARELGLEIALDYALQCSPDHPWVKDHPDWFTIRPDGSIMYAENPPKKYQDIYPINFWTEDREALWNACRDVLLFWIERGVTTFRVDNPHTKPFAFWEWVIREVHQRHPQVVFFAEAFTRPNKLLALAKLGFTQSYGYFTWKNTAEELQDWMEEFSTPEVLEYHRGNLFANTPDILNEFLVEGGRPAFRLRLLLAGTLSPLYGIYSGYELGENVPVRPGSEEYLDSEKYQLRQRDYGAAGNLDADLRRLNRIRRAQPALQRADNLRFVPSDNPQILCFARTRHGLRGQGAGDDLLVVVNLDPHAAHETTVHVPLAALGLRADAEYVVEDLLTGVRYTWRGSRNYVRLDPNGEPGHVLRIVRALSHHRPSHHIMSLDNPLWYKDAIIYQVHVKSFRDSDRDGYGDFRGLMQKLDYVQSLGVNCIWLLPFYPSPLKDDGYDIAEYNEINPTYGTLDDFRAFMEEAHRRGLKVITELVINHTSDQHPWFQRARTAPKGSPERNWYVWSDDPHLYEGTRIIFTDTEKSNWTWDPVAEQFFWHRFFSHQPDLNFDNPDVREAVKETMRFWLDMGVDGLRLDAIPYLIERHGTNCENLPETHEVLKELRAAMDERYENRVFLAEANQWPPDVRPYFGDSDECHMAFHFPLMPRMYMALRREDRTPIVEIMERTPSIPDDCQWAIFLRNHDELTLEMVTDEERDYMYNEYASDRRMRINVGIRRRLAPLLDNGRRQIELMNGLLFSMPGTPIIYYGDEIGMGDNVYLGDRNGVRTPMQWNAWQNAGFSEGDSAALFGPVIVDVPFAFQAVNVEAQERTNTSLLRWMRRAIKVRGKSLAFGRGSFEPIDPANKKVLVFLRRYEQEVLLCVNNLSRFAQPVELDLSAFAGWTPVELFSDAPFPKIGELPYFLTLGPHNFFWFRLTPPEPVADAEVAAAAAAASAAPAPSYEADESVAPVDAASAAMAARAARGMS